jgi:hypothetical protein
MEFKMRSHHAPTKHLLERFTFRDLKARNGRAIWIFEKDRAPRSSRDLASECAQHGYFGGADNGEDEYDIDARFNQEYELPFNNILSAIDSNLCIFQSLEIRKICARYVAHLFHRSKARRDGGSQLLVDLIERYLAIAKDEKKLRAYTAKVSIIARRSISFEEVRNVLVRQSNYYLSEEGKQTLYVNDIDRATESLAAHLTPLHWSVIKSQGLGGFFISDTPVISLARDHWGAVTYGVGIGQPTAEWFMPISHSRVLRIARRQRLGEVADSAEVNDLNVGQIVTMTDRLYGRNPSKWIDQIVQSHGGMYKFHSDVFKGDLPLGFEDEFDEVLSQFKL